MYIVLVQISVFNYPTGKNPEESSQVSVQTIKLELNVQHPA
jgi:hypothetical protein